MSNLRADQSLNVLSPKMLNAIPEVTRITCLADLGTYEVQTVTYNTYANSTNADYLHIVNKTGTKYAIWLDKSSTKETFTVTAPTFAAATHGDYFSFENPAALKSAVWLDKEFFETFTAAIPATAAATQADYFHFTSPAGLKTAVWLDIDSNGTAPTGALYLAADNKIKASIVAGNTNIQNAAAVVSAIGSTPTGYAIVNNGDGTLKFTASDRGTATDAAPKNANDSGAGSITTTTTVQGTAATAPSGAIYIAATNKIKVTITTGDTAAQVGTKIYNAIGATVTGFAKVDNLDGTLTFTSLTRGAATNAAPHTENDGGAGSISISIDVNGANATAPSGALYSASNYQIKYEITTGQTAAQIATGVKAAIEADVNWAEFTITNPSAGVLVFTSTKLGNLTNAAPKNANDSGAGSIVVANTTAGVASNLQNKYFIMRTAGATVYNAWINVSSEGVDPNPAGSEIECACTAGSTAAQIAASLATAINANANFKAWVQDDYLYVANEATGVATDVSAGNSGFTITKIQDGKAGYLYPSMSPSSYTNEPSLIS